MGLEGGVGRSVELFRGMFANATDFERVQLRDSWIILLLSLSTSLLPKDSREGVERRLDSGLESSLESEVTVKGALFLTRVEGGSAGGGLISDDTPSTAAVTLTVSSEAENPLVALPSYRSLSSLL